MRLVFDDDLGYGAFQFMWMALHLAELKMNLPRARTFASLDAKLSAVSKDFEGGRVLARECVVDLTPEEHLLVVDAIGATPWKRDVHPQVVATCVFLGANVERVA